MLYKIEEGKVEAVDKTKLPEENVLEENLEGWIEAKPFLLGEPLLIIGRQVQLEDVKDRLDLLAIDKQGNLVAVEVKRDLIGGDTDFQALRYASYISRWEYQQIENQAVGYWLNKKGVDGVFSINFVEELEKFCDEGYELNQNQRIIVVGGKIKGRIGSVALWLREQGVDFKVVTIAPYKDKGVIYLQPHVVIPVPTVEEYRLGRLVAKADKPWLRDGEGWHLKSRCSEETAKTLLELSEVLGSIPEAQGPNWGQKFYVSFKVGGSNWAYVNTHRTMLDLDLRCDPQNFDLQEIAKNLGIEVFDEEASLSEKFQLKSSIRKSDDIIRIKIKPDFDVQSDAFRNLLSLALKSYLKGF